MGDDIFDFEALLKEGEAALDQFPYDIASAHYESEDFPKDVTIEASFRHMVMYLGWAIDRELISDRFKMNCADMIMQFKKRLINPTDLFKGCCGNELTKEHFNNTGNDFTKMYYRPGWKHTYTNDYNIMTGWPDKHNYLEDTWENLDKVKSMIDERYKEWLEEQKKN